MTTGVVGTSQSQKGQLNNLLLLGEGIVWQQDGHFVGERLTPVGPASSNSVRLVCSPHGA